MTPRSPRAEEHCVMTSGDGSSYLKRMPLLRRMPRRLRSQTRRQRRQRLLPPPRASGQPRLLAARHRTSFVSLKSGVATSMHTSPRQTAHQRQPGCMDHPFVHGDRTQRLVPVQVRRPVEVARPHPCPRRRLPHLANPWVHRSKCSRHNR